MVKQLFDRFFEKPLGFQIMALGIILINIGIILLYISTEWYTKLSISLILFGSLSLSLLSQRKRVVSDMLCGYHILIILTLWIISILLVSYTINPEFFLVILIIGILSVKVFGEELIDPAYKGRINMLFYVFFSIFVILFIQRLYVVLNF